MKHLLALNSCYSSLIAVTLKPLTVSLPEKDLKYARTKAEALGISVGVYHRLMFRQSIRTKDANSEKRAEALKAFSKVMSNEAEENSYQEDDVVYLAKAARKHLSNA